MFSRAQLRWIHKFHTRSLQPICNATFALTSHIHWEMVWSERANTPQLFQRPYFIPFWLFSQYVRFWSKRLLTEPMMAITGRSPWCFLCLLWQQCPSSAAQQNLIPFHVPIFKLHKLQSCQMYLYETVMLQSPYPVHLGSFSLVIYKLLTQNNIKLQRLSLKFFLLFIPLVYIATLVPLFLTKNSV